MQESSRFPVTGPLEAGHPSQVSWVLWTGSERIRQKVRALDVLLSHYLINLLSGVSSLGCWRGDRMGWLGTHRSSRGRQWRMAPATQPRPHPRKPSFRGCRNSSPAAQGRWKEVSRQSVLREVPPYRPDMQHSLPQLDTPASGPNISSGRHSPSGVIRPVPSRYPCLQMETQFHGHFHQGHVGWLRICFSSLGVSTAWKTGSALGESGSVS